jgi:hypothetical protein
MVREVVERLKSVARVGVVGDTVLACTVQVLQDMKRCLVVLSARGMTVRGEKGESWCHVRSSALSEPINRTDYSLVKFGATFQVGILVIGGWKRVDRETGPVGCHVGDTFELVQTVAMSGMFSKGRLGHVHRDVAIFVAFPQEGGAEKVIYVSHKIHCDFGL